MGEGEAIKAQEEGQVGQELRLIHRMDRRIEVRHLHRPTARCRSIRSSVSDRPLPGAGSSQTRRERAGDR